MTILYLSGGGSAVMNESSRHSRHSTQRNRSRVSTIFSFITDELLFGFVKKGAYPEKIAHFLYCHIKLAFILTVYVFSSCSLFIVSSRFFACCVCLFLFLFCFCL